MEAWLPVSDLSLFCREPAMRAQGRGFDSRPRSLVEMKKRTNELVAKYGTAGLRVFLIQKHKR